MPLRHRWTCLRVRLRWRWQLTILPHALSQMCALGEVSPHINSLQVGATEAASVIGCRRSNQVCVLHQLRRCAGCLGNTLLRLHVASRVLLGLSLDRQPAGAHAAHCCLGRRPGRGNPRAAPHSEARRRSPVEGAYIHTGGPRSRWVSGACTCHAHRHRAFRTASRHLPKGADICQMSVTFGKALLLINGPFG